MAFEVAPRTSQAPSVRAPTLTAIVVNHTAARFARSCERERDSWARRTIAITWERYVSSPVLVTSIVTAASPFTDPPMTAVPFPFSTGLLSPVSIASLTLVCPSTITPSVGIFSPGFTRTRSPRISLVTGTSWVEPSSFTRWASAGIRRTRLSRAAEAPSTDFISIQ